MLRAMKKGRFFPSLILGGTIGLAFVGEHASAQDLESDALAIVPPPSELASHFLLNADLVALGEFGEPVELGDDTLSLLRSRELDVAFTVRTVYKGAVRPGNIVQIRLRSDMLAYPGEDISRYEKRITLFEEKREELQGEGAKASAIDQDFLDGRISQFERSQRLRDLDEANRQLIADNQELRKISRYITVTHASTFYERGGVIHSNQPYLIAVNAIDGNVNYYALGETDGSVMWGELAQEVRAETERLRELCTGTLERARILGYCP